MTSDVSRGGVFIKTDVPKSKRQLLRIQLDLGDKKAPIEVHGMVVHTVSPEEATERGEAPGLGIEFIAFGGEPRQRWEDYIRQLPGQPRTSPFPPVSAPVAVPERPASTTPSTPPAAAPEPVKRPVLPAAGDASGFPMTPGQVAPNVKITHKRPKRESLVRHVFPIPLEDIQQLYEIYERDFTSGWMFLYTGEKIPIGERVTARLIHPLNGDEFDIHAKVKEVHEDPSYPGLTLAIRPSTLARREKFRAFIEQGIPEEDLSVDMVDEE
jgi:Tfp pilus assembly protein PilZ